MHDLRRTFDTATHPFHAGLDEEHIVLHSAALGPRAALIVESVAFTSDRGDAARVLIEVGVYVTNA